MSKKVFRGQGDFRHCPLQSRTGFYCLAAGNASKFADMNETIQWPDGEFTIQEAVELNRGLPEAVVRQKLSALMQAKAIVQTQKGNQKVKGKFQVVKPAS